MRRFVTGLAIVLLALPLSAQKVQEQMLVSPDWLQRRLGIVTVLHIGDTASYDARHIPGAVLIEMSSLLVQRNGTPNELPPIDALERLFLRRHALRRLVRRVEQCRGDDLVLVQGSG